MPTLQETRKNAHLLLAQVREDLDDRKRGRDGRSTAQLDDRQRKALADLRRDGFAVVRDYWPRDRAIAARDRLEARLADGVDHDYDEGAWLRFWDDRAYDQGVRRIYHVDKVEPELTDLRHDRFVFDIADAYYGIPFHSGVLVYQHNTQTNENTRTFHVDAFIKEFKAFVYLDDVDDGNGPFTYLRGTQRKHALRLKKQLLGNGPDESPTTFFPQDVGKAADDEVRVLGPAGTLILADVRGLHRGSPQVDRSRSVLVNYLVKHEGDLELDR